MSVPITPPKFFSKDGQSATSPQSEFDWQQLQGFFIKLSAKTQSFTSAAQTTIAGSTSGSATFSQPFTGPNYNKVIIHLNALNGTATYTFQFPFTNTPVAVSTSGLSTSLITALSPTAVTVTGTGSTGVLLIEGY